MFRARKSYAFFGLKNVSFLGLFWLAHWPIKGPGGCQNILHDPQIFSEITKSIKITTHFESCDYHT